MKTIATALFALLFISALDAHASDCLATAGGVSVDIPSPEKSFTEVGGEKREFFEYMVPARNRLVCAFVPIDYLPHLRNPATGMDRYMVIEVSRRLDEKNTDITSASFEQIVATTKQQIGDTSQLNNTARASAEEVSNKLKALQNSKDVSIQNPTPLGTILQSTDAYGFLMIVPVSSGGGTVKMLGASLLMRVRNRLLFAYIYGADDESSLRWVRATAAEWSHEILVANPAK